MAGINDPYSPRRPLLCSICKPIVPKERLFLLTECVPEGSNCDTSQDKIVCARGSVIISPSGTILAGPNYKGESLISVDLDPREIVQAKLDFGGIGHRMGPNSIK